MSNAKFTDLPSVLSAQMADIFCVVQGGISSEETNQQVFNLFLSNMVLNYAGDPNGHVAGVIYQLCYDTADQTLYVCTSSGSTTTAVWTSSTTGLIGPDQGGTGVANPPVHTLPVAEGSSNFTFLGPLTNGQLLIGSIGANPVPATLTAGTGINITNGTGSITIESTMGSGLLAFSVVTSNQAMDSNLGYITNGVGTVSLALPSTSSVGDQIGVIAGSAPGFSITQGSGQQIVVGSALSTSGNTGFVASTSIGDSLTLICMVANTTWICWNGVQGNLTVN